MRASALLPLQLRATLGIDRGSLKNRAAIVEQMADDMRVYSTSRGCVTEDDLSLLGWKPQQIQSFGASARLQAIKLSSSR